MSMNKKPIFLIFFFLIVGTLSLFALFQSKKNSHDMAQPDTGSVGKKIKYWWDPMMPEFRSDKPGKSPMGMDLVPVYEDSESTSKEKKIKYWWDPMMPEFRSDKPGKSPMGMDLVPVYEESEGAAEVNSNIIKIDPAIVQNIGVQTEKTRKGNLEMVIRTVGHLDYDERKVGNINLKMNGWIEKLYVNYTGQKVKIGDPLFSIYSPELVSAQSEYLLSRERGSSDDQISTLSKSAKQKLKYWDISDRQIKELEKEGVVKKTLNIYSPFNGIIVKKNIVEGQYQTSGTVLYQIADLSNIWVYVHIYEYELPWIKTGLEAEMELSYIPGKIFKGKVTYIYPYLNKETRDVKVRVEFANPDLELKPDMYATIRIRGISKEEVIIAPEEAIIDTGERQIVFVALGEGRFEQRKIRVGVRTGDQMEVLEGLSADELIVTSGQFLLDSESRLKQSKTQIEPEAAQPMNHEHHDMKTQPEPEPEPQPMNHANH